MRHEPKSANYQAKGTISQNGLYTQTPKVTRCIVRYPAADATYAS